MAWSLARKVSAALLVTLMGTAAVSGGFATSKFESEVSSLVRSRYGVQVYAIKRNVEDRLALGLPLRSLRPVQEAIERQKVEDQHILGIEIYDTKGEILFDTDRGAIGTPVPPGWVRAAAAGGAGPFSDSDDDGRLVGLPLANNLGQVEGGVVLRYPAGYFEERFRPLLLRILRDAGVLLALFAVVAVAGAHLLFRPVIRKLAAMGATLDGDGGAVPPEPEKDGDEDFEAAFAVFTARTSEAVADMRESFHDVERLDRLA